MRRNSPRVVCITLERATDDITSLSVLDGQLRLRGLTEGILHHLGLKDAAARLTTNSMLETCCLGFGTIRGQRSSCFTTKQDED